MFAKRCERPCFLLCPTLGFTPAERCNPMCRFLAYHGEPILLETLVASPSHSLIKQSQHAAEGKTETNGDGFGVGWYGERSEPGLYR